MTETLIAGAATGYLVGFLLLLFVQGPTTHRQFLLEPPVFAVAGTATAYLVHFFGG